ncbi:MAG TPA: hypothetical protein VGD63_13490 [Steroidobacteraceae bacterium]
MAEPEVLVPIRCPICLQESLVGFRFSVLEDALATGEIRLYANCHVTSWQGSAPELAAVREYLDTVWGTGLQESCPAFFALDRFLDGDSLSFIYSGVLTVEEMSKVPELAPNRLSHEPDPYQKLLSSIDALASDITVSDGEMRKRLRSLLATSALNPTHPPAVPPRAFATRPRFENGTLSRSVRYDLQPVSLDSHRRPTLRASVICSQRSQRTNTYTGQAKDFTTH